MADRYEFSAKTKKIIAERAGYRCSFTDCNAFLIGPHGDTSIELGECAHIYSASGEGPRGQENLSEDAIKSSENGIYLCHKHHKLIDSAEGSKIYDAQTLLQMKEAHEYKVSCEIDIQQRPMTRIKSIRVLSHPLFKKGTVFSFTKTTILEGDNGSGKTTLIETLYGLLTGSVGKRWENDEIELELTLDNPVAQTMRYRYKEDVTRYYGTDDHLIGFNPYDFEVFYLHDSDAIFKPGIDDIETIAHQLGITTSAVMRMVEAVELEDPIMATQVAFTTVEDSEGKMHECLLLKMLENGRLLHYYQLSSSQQSGFLLDLVSGYMKRVAKYKHALLLIDWGAFCSFDESWKNKYLASLKKTGNNVQTIITTPHPLNRIAVGGWTFINLDDESIHNKD